MPLIAFHAGTQTVASYGSCGTRTPSHSVAILDRALFWRMHHCQVVKSMLCSLATGLGQTRELPCL